MYENGELLIAIEINYAVLSEYYWKVSYYLLSHPYTFQVHFQVYRYFNFETLRHYLKTYIHIK